MSSSGYTYRRGVPKSWIMKGRVAEHESKELHSKTKLLLKKIVNLKLVLLEIERKNFDKVEYNSIQTIINLGIRLLKKYFSTYTKNSQNIEYELKTGITTRKNLIKKKNKYGIDYKNFELNNDKEFVLSKYVGGKKDPLLKIMEGNAFKRIEAYREIRKEFLSLFNIYLKVKIIINFYNYFKNKQYASSTDEDINNILSKIWKKYNTADNEYYYRIGSFNNVELTEEQKKSLKILNDELKTLEEEDKERWDYIENSNVVSIDTESYLPQDERQKYIDGNSKDEETINKLKKEAQDKIDKLYGKIARKKKEINELEFNFSQDTKWEKPEAGILLDEYVTELDSEILLPIQQTDDKNEMLKNINFIKLNLETLISYYTEDTQYIGFTIVDTGESTDSNFFEIKNNKVNIKQEYIVEESTSNEVQSDLKDNLKDNEQGELIKNIEKVESHQDTNDEKLGDMKSSKMTGAKIGIMVAKAASKNINSNNIRILKSGTSLISKNMGKFFLNTIGKIAENVALFGGRKKKYHKKKSINTKKKTKENVVAEEKKTKENEEQYEKIYKNIIII